MALVEQLAAFVVCANYDNLSEEARRQLKVRVLDALGCAIGALDGKPVQIIRLINVEKTACCNLLGKPCRI